MQDSHGGNMTETFTAKYRHVASRLVAGSDPAFGPAPDRLLTIAIPTYKRPELLRETLESVRLQTADPDSFEVVVVDNDPEGDDLLAAETMTGMGFRRFAYYRNAENMGMFGNWNRSIELAKSRWMTILNDDDMLKPDYVRQMSALLGKTELLSCNFSFHLDSVNPRLGAFSRLKSAVKPLLHGKGSARTERRDLRDYFYKNGNAGCLGLIFDRNCALEIGGFDESLYPSADYYFFAEYVRRHSECHLRMLLVSYRIGFNDCARPDIGFKFVAQNYAFRQQWAKDALGSPALSSFAKLLAVSDIRGMNRLWRSGLDCREVGRKLDIPPLLNNSLVATIAYAAPRVRQLYKALFRRTRRLATLEQ